MHFVLLLVVIVFAECWSIAQVSHKIGFWATLILIIADIIFGVKLLRAQGINSMLKSVQNMQAGESPMGAIADGIVKGLAGILLIIPGFFSDLIALVILLPFVRKPFASYLSRNGQFQAGSFGGFSSFGMGGFGRPGNGDSFGGGNVYEHEGSARTEKDDVIEGQVIEHKPDQDPKN